MQSDIRSKAAFVALAFLALALYPLVAGNFGVDLVTKIMIYAIFALSLELLVGGTGLVCFGHAAFFGIGAYATVLLSPESAPGSWRPRCSPPGCTRWPWAHCRYAPRGCTSSW